MIILGGTFRTGTFSGNVSVGGVLTYEDVTNIDSVGFTARAGVITPNVNWMNIILAVVAIFILVITLESLLPQQP